MHSVPSVKSIVISSVLLSWLAVPPPPLSAQGSSQASPRLTAAADSADQTQTRQRRRRRRSTSSSNVGYIDNAIVGTQLQIRYDFAEGVDRPDRSEFIYAKCGCYREAGLDPDAPGPAPSFAGIDPFTTPVIETDMKIHDIVLDAEYAFHDRVSAFVEVPFRVADLSILPNTSGIGDLRAGVKIAAVADSLRYLTLQVAAYLPTGEPLDGLGTDHFSVEPALLYHEGSFDRFRLEGELRLWIPISGSTGLGAGTFGASDDFSAPVVRYGVGIGYDVTPTAPVRFTPVLEFVGWTVTSGIVTGSPDGTLTGVSFDDASGDTIINVKVGARLGVRANDAIFIGYGRGLTDKVWYKNIVRVEYRLVL